MEQCIAYHLSRISRHAWERCVRPAARGSRFCRTHTNSLHGALLGLCTHGYPERNTASIFDNARAIEKFSKGGPGGGKLHA